MIFEHFHRHVEPEGMILGIMTNVFVETPQNLEGLFVRLTHRLEETIASIYRPESAPDRCLIKGGRRDGSPCVFMVLQNIQATDWEIGALLKSIGSRPMDESMELVPDDGSGQKRMRQEREELR